MNDKVQLSKKIGQKGRCLFTNFTICVNTTHPTIIPKIATPPKITPEIFIPLDRCSSLKNKVIKRMTDSAPNVTVKLRYFIKSI